MESAIDPFITALVNCEVTAANVDWAEVVTSTSITYDTSIAEADVRWRLLEVASEAVTFVTSVSSTSSRFSATASTNASSSSSPGWDVGIRGGKPTHTHTHTHTHTGTHAHAHTCAHTRTEFVFGKAG